MERYDVVVVGGGAMGSAAAWQLAVRGRSVLLLERFERGHVRGSSHSDTRIFRLAYTDPVYVRLGLEALELWRQLEAETATTLLETTGGVDHGAADEVEALSSSLGTCGVEHELLSPRAASERFAGMRFDGTVLHHPQAGRVWAARGVAALQDAAAASGAEVRYEAPVREARIGHDRVEVRLEGGAIAARRIVLAAGAWASHLVPRPITLPLLRVTNEQVHHWPIAAPATWPTFVHRGDPAHYGLLTPGLGVKVAEHQTGPEVDPDRRTFGLDAATTARLRRYVADWFPGLDPEPVEGHRCLYTLTPSQDFVLDRSGPVVVAAGFSGHGFKFAPAVGRILADLATDGPAPDATFSLERALAAAPHTAAR